MEPTPPRSGPQPPYAGATGNPVPPGHTPPAPPPAPASPHEVYQGPPGAAPPPRKTETGLGLTFGCLGCGALAVVGVIVAVVGVMFFGFSVLSEQVGDSVRDNPVVLEHLGNIESVKMDVIGSIADPDPDLFVYNVEGSKGSGQLRVNSISLPNGSEQVVSGVLRMDDGQVYELFPDAEDGADDGG